VGVGTGVCADYPKIRSENSALTKNDRVIEKVPRADKFGDSSYQQREVGEMGDNCKTSEEKRCVVMAVRPGSHPIA
jgi:hypothetical protein